jgi:acyl carrier protein
MSVRGDEIDAGATLLAIKRLICEVGNLPNGPDTIADQASLFEECGLDSTSIVQLVLAIERELGLSMPDEDVIGDVFESPASLAAWVNSRMPS